MTERPDFRYERALWKKGYEIVVGLDEVGTGSLAGPLLVGAVVWSPSRKRIHGVRDSKQLSIKERNRLYPDIKARANRYVVSGASVREIEKHGVWAARDIAFKRALKKIGHYDHLLIDGVESKRLRELGPLTTIIGGDKVCFSIASASILAKVTRDHLLDLLSIRHPDYGWERNRGYSTEFHLNALREHGPTSYHRKRYAPVQRILSGEQMDLFDPEAEFLSFELEELLGDQSQDSSWGRTSILPLVASSLSWQTLE